MESCYNQHLCAAAIYAMYDFMDEHPVLYDAFGHYVCAFNKLPIDKKLSFSDYRKLSISDKKRYINLALNSDIELSDLSNINITMYHEMNKVITKYKQYRY